MNEDLKTPQRRAIQYFYSDGSFEFGFGLLCLVLGIYFFVENRLQGTWLAVLADSLLVFAVVGGAFLISWLVRKWKERVTFPRTGYIGYPRIYGLKRGWRSLIGLVAGGVLTAAAVFLLVNEDVRVSIMPLLTGIVFGIVMIFVGWRTSLPRFYIQAVLSMLAGIGLAFSTLGNYVGLAAYYLVIGLILLISGAFILRKYLRQNPVPAEEQNER
jgi:hypothetical protein